MKKLLFIPAIIFLSLSVLPLYAASDNPCDCAGWDKTRWGMSSEDVKRVYQAAAVEQLYEDENEITLCIRNYFEVDGTHPFVTVSVDKKSGLKRVSVCHNFVEKGSASKVREAIALIQGKMEKEYGKPQAVRMIKGVASKVMDGNIDLRLSKWSLPSADIELVEYWNQDVPTSYNLNYSCASLRKF